MLCVNVRWPFMCEQCKTDVRPSCSDVSRKDVLGKFISQMCSLCPRSLTVSVFVCVLGGEVCVCVHVRVCACMLRERVRERERERECVCECVCVCVCVCECACMCLLFVYLNF